MRISDWSSDVCSSDLESRGERIRQRQQQDGAHDPIADDPEHGGGVADGDEVERSEGGVEERPDDHGQPDQRQRTAEELPMEPELDGRFDKAQRHLVEPIGTIRVDLGSFVWALRHVFRPTWYHRRNATPNRRTTRASLPQVIVPFPLKLAFRREWTA